MFATMQHRLQLNAEAEVLKLSRGISIALIVVYIIYVILQMRLDRKRKQNEAGDGPAYIPLENVEDPADARNDSHVDLPSSVHRRQMQESKDRQQWNTILASKLRDNANKRTRLPPAKQDQSTQGEHALPTDRQDLFGQAREQHIDTQRPIAATSSPPSTPRYSSDGSEPTFQATRSSVGDSTDRDSRSSIDSACPALPFEEPYSPASTDDMDPLPTNGSSMNQTSPTPLPIAVIVLLLATGIVSISTELAVDSIPHIVDSHHISHVFIGFIVLPVVGNAAEHVIAIKLALSNNMALAKSVAVESSTQVALLLAPLIVLLGWIRDRKMTLNFDLFELASVTVTSAIVTAVICYGQTGWKQACMLLSIYSLLAVASVMYRGQ
jgi:Ca2+/H+ antiporter